MKPSCNWHLAMLLISRVFRKCLFILPTSYNSFIHLGMKYLRLWRKQNAKNFTVNPSNLEFCCFSYLLLFSPIPHKSCALLCCFWLHRDIFHVYFTSTVLSSFFFSFSFLYIICYDNCLVYVVFSFSPILLCRRLLSTSLICFLCGFDFPNWRSIVNSLLHVHTTEPFTSRCFLVFFLDSA